MSSTPENTTRHAGQGAVATDYDDFAEAYAAETESSLLNAYYSRPAIVDLAGDVSGRRILDVGCGTGPMLAELRNRGAEVTGVDPSVKMLELARRRLGEGVALHRAGLGGAPLPFPDGAFDDVIVCLVLHYLEDWKGPLAELRRVLVPGGRVFIALNHPHVLKYEHPEADYFATHRYTDEYTFAGQKVPMTFWHRPLPAMTDAFTAAGFRTSVIAEPPPAPGAHEAFPDIVKEGPGAQFLCFLFFVLEAV